MRKSGLGSVLLVTCSLAACKSPLKASKAEEASAAAPAAATAQPTANVSASAAAAAASGSVAGGSASAPAAATSKYSTAGLRAIADDCVAPLVILTAVPRSVFESEGFTWRFASQVAVANPQFAYPIVDMPGPSIIRFKNVEHTPTKGIALVATCNSAETCTQFAAAYRTVVPTSKPEVLCGKATTLGAEVQGARVLNFDAGEIILASLPAKDNVIGQCVRLAACQAERDKKLDGDPALACQKKPSTFKLACAEKFPCSAVLSCLEQ
jgi:hypothetical protein